MCVYVHTYTYICFHIYIYMDMYVYVYLYVVTQHSAVKSFVIRFVDVYPPETENANNMLSGIA